MTSARPASGGPSPSSPEQPWPVRTVSTKVAQWIDRLGSVWVEGQITQINARPGTRTAFLVLRDPSVDMSLSVTCSPQLLRDAPVPLTEGSRVVMFGKLSFWTGRGSVSLRVTEIRAVGIGELLARIERLRALLAAEGLFDPRLKRPLPFLPGTIGLITGRASAAEHDVLSSTAIPVSTSSSWLAAAAASRTCCRSPTRRCAARSSRARRRWSVRSVTSPTAR